MARRFSRPGIPGRITPWALLLTFEALLLVAYFASTSTQVLEPRYVLYPFVWINLGLWAIVRTPLRRSGRRTTTVAAVLAVGYFIVLAWFSGLVTLAHHTDGLAGWISVTVNQAPPGWGPRVTVLTDVLTLVFVPYRVLGYAGLAVLVYDGVLDAAASTVSGVAGLFSCLGCAFPIVGSFLATLGGSSALIVAVRTFSVDLSTLAFVLAVGLLLWRPSLEEIPVHSG